MKHCKKLFAMVLAVMTMLCAVPVVPALAEEETSELQHFTVGMLDMGAWNATSGPQYAQVELAAEALNCDIIYTAYDASAEGLLIAAQNLIASGVDAILMQNGHWYMAAFLSWLSCAMRQRFTGLFAGPR